MARSARIGQGTSVTAQTEPLKVATPSPLAGLVDALRGMAANRKYLAGLNDGVNINALEDIEMMLHEKLVAGIRTTWVRRVALPVFMADKMLGEAFQHPDEKARALKAIEILNQCTDIFVRENCKDWICETYNVSA